MKKKSTNVLFEKRKNIINIIMRSFIFFFCSTVFAFSPGNIFSQNIKVQIESDKKITIDEVFNIIKQQTDFNFIYKSDIFKDYPKVDVKKGSITANKLLKESLSNGHFKLDISGNKTIVISKDSNTNPLQEIIITGQVVDENGMPIPGVSIYVTTRHPNNVKVISEFVVRGTITDFDGKFSIQAEAGYYLVASGVSYEKYTQQITINKSVYNIVLKESINALSEIVLVSTGYQKIYANKNTGATSTVNSKTIERKGNSNLLESLEGQVAGLGFFSDPSREGAKKFDIRGVTSINGDSRPLIIVDGFPLEADISTINPYEIESVTFLKDAASSSIYGARAANGVVVIVTKKGKSGSLNISYRSFLTTSSRPDLSYRLNRVNSSDLVEIQKTSAGANPHTYQWQLNNSNNPGYYATASTLVYETRAKLNEDLITQDQAEAIYSSLKSKDNTKQFEKNFLRPKVEQQHSISISGGGDRNTFRSSLNYTKNQSEWAGDKSNKVIFDIVNSLKVNEKVGVDLIGNVVLNSANSTPVPQNLVFGGVNSYEEIIDKNGNYLPVRLTGVNSGSTDNGGMSGGKDAFEIQRLLDAGLLDETYYPLNELGAYTVDNNGLTVRLQAMLNAHLTKNLAGYFALQYESGSTRIKNLASKESFEMKSLINNTTPLSYTGDVNELNIPLGSRLIETRSNRNSYTLRGQLDFNSSIDNHDISAIIGSEIRNVFNTQTITDKFGYDDKTLLFRPINRKDLEETINGVYHPLGYIGGGISFNDDFDETTNRYFSLYGNFTYAYKNKYILSGSARIDQSNLFGTDPKYRYKPFWSVGGKWRVAQEDFFDVSLIDKLDFRISYGINGNISNKNGPFNIATAMFPGRSGYVQSLSITSPAISDLRWERTGTTNFGMDLNFFNNRIALGLDYYIKNTTDLIAYGKSNPTLGFTNLVRNDANITNNGIEVSLSTENIKNGNFSWSTFFTLRHNKNRVNKAYFDEIYGYYASGLRNYEGAPANTFWHFDWNGLNENGEATIKKANGNIIVLNSSFKPLNDLDLDDLLNAGTTEPIYSGAITNTFTFKDLSLSFMFIGNGGHVLLKDSYNGEYIGREPRNVNSDAANSWKAPGDELLTDIPMINTNSPYGPTITRSSTKNIISGDYIKLREVILTYFLSDGLLNSTTIDRIQFNLKVGNLFYIAKNKLGIDPEAQGLGSRFFPNNPSYSLGVTINF